MVGNVREWVEDASHEPSDEPPTDGSAFETLGQPYARVLKGGSFDTLDPQFLRPSFMQALPARDDRTSDVGVRCCQNAFSEPTALPDDNSGGSGMGWAARVATAGSGGDLLVGE